jgi:hypothetical protein
MIDKFNDNFIILFKLQNLFTSMAMVFPVFPELKASCSSPEAPPLFPN